MGSSTVIGMPTDEKAFEENCVPLFAGLLNDPNVKLLGTRGKKQFGLDLIARRDRDPEKPVGIQCKLITRGGKLKENVVRSEVAQALTIKPPLSEFYIVTTATDEPALDFLAIELAQEQASLNRKIDIQIWGWDTLQEKIRTDPRALAAFDPDYSASTSRLIELGDETVSSQAHLRAQNEQVLKSLDVLVARSITTVPEDTARSAFDQHLDAQIDQYRVLMIHGKPRTALTLLEKLEETIDETRSVEIRARLKANIAIARIRLGNEANGAELLVDAFALNPDDPKARANNILALALQGKLADAWAFAATVLREDKSNVGAAGLAFQVAAMSDQALDPNAIVPAPLLDELNVRIHQISFMRARGESAIWWELAADTLSRFPDDGNAIRMAGEALIDEALDGGAIESNCYPSKANHEALKSGAVLLQRHWDEVRHYENADDTNLIMVGFNLITAYRMLGSLDAAQVVVEQTLALLPHAPETLLSAAWVAIERGEFSEAVKLLRKTPVTPDTTLPLLVALSNTQNWSEVIAEGTDDRRRALDSADRQLFDVLLFRARQGGGKVCVDLDAEVDALIERWPLGVCTHIAVADIYQTTGHKGLVRMAAKAKSLITSSTSFADRLMFAQLSLHRESWEDIIYVLDGHVDVGRPSEPLEWLAYAFANAPTRSRTSKFFQSLGPEVIKLPRYSRLAGAAEHNRGDLKSAERFLRSAIAEDPSDLRAMLLLASAITRDNRETDAFELLAGIVDNEVNGSAEDLMRLAHHHRRAGAVERALRLAYRVAASNRQNEAVVSTYPALIFLDEALPHPIGQAGPAQPDFWFDLEGLDGTRDVRGVIDDIEVPGVDHFDVDHPLATALSGKQVGDTVVMSAQFGPERKYRIRELKHKYIWLLHDIMATHAARFPSATSMFEMRMKDDDVQPVLDVLRDIQSQDDIVVATYKDFPIPLAAIAAISHKPVLELADRLLEENTNLRTCAGTKEEREEATDFVRGARGRGVVLDTLTVWQIAELGHLEAVKNYFGRLCIPRSSFDDFLELRARIESNRGREFMTVGFKGDQAWRQIHTPEDTEARLSRINKIIAGFEAQCEILPVDIPIDTQLDQLLGAPLSGKVLDPISLALSEDIIILSEDLNLRQYAAQLGVKGGAWLQITLNVLATDGVINRTQYLTSVGTLGMMLHDHLWLDSRMLLGILTLDDEGAFALYEAAIKFLGGRNAEMRSHLNVALGVMCNIWITPLPSWQHSRALGRLLEQLVDSRPRDWKSVLYALDNELGIEADFGSKRAKLARDYLIGWMAGHFYDVDGIRSEHHKNHHVLP